VSNLSRIIQKNLVEIIFRQIFILTKKQIEEEEKTRAVMQ
jgi:hypothetical protein